VSKIEAKFHIFDPLYKLVKEWGKNAEWDDRTD